MAELDTRKIRELNDHARQSFKGCRVVITRGIADLVEQVISVILAQVRSYDQFTPDNDPYGEHDFGSFHHGAVHVFWKRGWGGCSLPRRHRSVPYWLCEKSVELKGSIHD
jgi:hypothetical protein